ETHRQACMGVIHAGGSALDFPAVALLQAAVEHGQGAVVVEGVEGGGVVTATLEKGRQAGDFVPEAGIACEIYLLHHRQVRRLATAAGQQCCQQHHHCEPPCLHAEPSLCRDGATLAERRHGSV